jgi:hypothetical protein
MDKLAQELVPGTPTDRKVVVAEEIGKLGGELKDVQERNRERYRAITDAEEGAIGALETLVQNLRALEFPPEKIDTGMALMAQALSRESVAVHQEQVIEKPEEKERERRRNKPTTDQVLSPRKGRILGDQVLLETGGKNAILNIANNLQTRLTLAHFLFEHREQLEDLGITDDACNWNGLRAEEEKLAPRVERQNAGVEGQELDSQVLLSASIVQVVLSTCGDGRYTRKRKSVIEAIDQHVSWDIARRLREDAIKLGRWKEFDALLEDLDEKLSGYTVEYDRVIDGFKVTMGKHLNLG